jgi:hypothetical protein
MHTYCIKESRYAHFQLKLCITASITHRYWDNKCANAHLISNVCVSALVKRWPTPECERKILVQTRLVS